MRFRVHIADRFRGAARIHQIVHHDEAFTVAFGALEHFHFALVVMVIAGNADGIHIADAQFARQQARRYQTAAAYGNDACPFVGRQQAVRQLACVHLQHIPGNNVFFAHRIVSQPAVKRLIYSSGEKRLREIIETGRVEFQLYRGKPRDFRRAAFR